MPEIKNECRLTCQSRRSVFDSNEVAVTLRTKHLKLWMPEIKWVPEMAAWPYLGLEPILFAKEVTVTLRTGHLKL
jgi:hypothetical protein